MADDDKRKFEIPWATLLPLLAALAGVIAQFRPLVSARPSIPNEKPIEVTAQQDVDARLWQDPLAVAQKSKAQLDSDLFSRGKCRRICQATRARGTCREGCASGRGRGRASSSLHGHAQCGPLYRTGGIAAPCAAGRSRRPERKRFRAGGRGAHRLCHDPGDASPSS